MADIETLKPFHWGYHFDKIIEKRGGFDAIITNPPWESVEPNAKEFFAEYSNSVFKNKMSLNDFKLELEHLLSDEEIKNAWLEYQSRFIHQREYFRFAEQYDNQVPIINGKRHGKDVNLYKMFIEQCFNLLQAQGECGIVVPSGIYTDLGAKKLREMLFSQTKITGLFCFENRKGIFEGVDSRFKFVILTFEKNSITQEFPAKFMRHDVQELERFPSDESLYISVELVRKLSPDSLSVMEFKNEIDFHIADKITKFPLLGEKIQGKWSLEIHREFNMTDDAYLFHKEPNQSRLPLYEGKMIHQFTHTWSQPKYWINELEAREKLLQSRLKKINKLLKDSKNNHIFINTESIKLDYESYRLAFRDVARNTDERTMIATILHPKLFCPHTMSLEKVYKDNLIKDNLELNFSSVSSTARFFICAVLNNFVIDYQIRHQVTAHVSFFFIYNLPVPRLVEGEPYFNEIVERAAKLICTTPEFDDLAQEVGLGSHQNGVTAETERAKLRAELDGMIAHLYGLTEDEFKHILSTFPIVPEATKQAALEAYKIFTPLTGNPEIINLITQGESAQLEFKFSARWDIRENKQNKVMEEVILKDVAGFLNSYPGGTLLIGIDDDGNILGLNHDYQTFKKKNRDGYELFLTNDLLLKELGKDLAPYIHITFHEVEDKDVCRIILDPSPRPVYIKLKDPKSGQTKECLFIRTGNLTSQLDTPSNIHNYCKNRWS